MYRKYLLDYFTYHLSHLLGGRKYTDWVQQAIQLKKNIPIKNSALAQELEDACQKKGFLTYSEFLQIDQFGKNGYHSTHRQHGMTDAVARWPEALLSLCKEKKLHHIVEFGSGDGKVGAATLSLARKENYSLFWSGVEINEALQIQTLSLFHKKRLGKQLFQLVSLLQELHISKRCLFVFSYSLDNLIPDVVINNRQKNGYPNALLGIGVKNGFLSEFILPARDIKKSGTILKEGLYTDMLQYAWNLQNLKLHSMQRAYIPFQALEILHNVITMLPLYSQILIIDEFREPSHKQTYHMGIPRDLDTYSRDVEDIEKFYTTTGSNLLYFPLFLDTATSFLSQCGLLLEKKDGEHAFASKLSGRTFPLPKNPRTLALLTKPIDKKTVSVKNKKTFSLNL